MTGRPDTLLLLSGGLDSAYVLWSRVQQELPTHVHHVHYKSRMGRQEVESRAVGNILEWMDRHRGRGLITYSESGVDNGKLWVPFNYFLWAYWIGAILASPAGAGYQTVLYPLHSDDHPAEVRDSEIAVRTMVRLMAGREVNLEYPIRDMHKADIVAAMPEELLELCWWCAMPLNGRPCRSCQSCLIMAAALRNPAPCARLPAVTGWFCSRPGGHAGACSARKLDDGTTT